VAPGGAGRQRPRGVQPVRRAREAGSRDRLAHQQPARRRVAHDGLEHAPFPHELLQV
jgi:hypothetical protein